MGSGRRFGVETLPSSPRKGDGLFKGLAYIYVGTSAFEEDRKFYTDVLGARVVWDFKEFGARVAAFDLGGEPYLLIADHVKAPSKRLIYEVSNLKEATKELRARGWSPDGETFEIPDGPCVNFKDKSGNEYAILQRSRPRILERDGSADNDSDVARSS